MQKNKGFTLIELSIVLVIIGLITGGIVLGRHLISASEVQSQLTQIDQFQSAVSIFSTKYGYLPGDIKDPDATKFGFIPRGTGAGEGNGDGVLYGDAAVPQGHIPGNGENGVFWIDLSTAHLIPYTFHTASISAPPTTNITATTTPALKDYFPVSAMDSASYIYTYSGGTYPGVWVTTGINYFGLSRVDYLSGTTFPPGRLYSHATIEVAKAYAMDKKIDDGLPISGTVTATYLNNDIFYTDGTDALYGPPSTAAIPATTSTCTDNNNQANTPQRYTLSVNSGAGKNCALSFQFQ